MRLEEFLKVYEKEFELQNESYTKIGKFEKGDIGLEPYLKREIYRISPENNSMIIIELEED